MVDRVVSRSENSGITAFLIRADNILLNDGYFDAPGLIENMAQSTAALLGSRPGMEQGKAPVGFIGGVKGLKIKQHPRAGDEIKTSVTILHDLSRALVVAAEVSLDDQVVAWCELKVFLMDTDE